MAINKNKAVVKLGVTDAKSQKAAKKALVGLGEGRCYTLDFEKSTLVVLGDIDPTVLVNRLRKYVKADLVTFGPEKEEEKPPKKDGGGGNVNQQPPKNDGGGGKVDQQPQQQPFYPPYDVYGYGYNNYW